MKTFFAVSAIAIGVLGTQPAWAVATASATLSGVSYTLIDLNLTDGIAPAITFSGQSSQTAASSGGVFDFDSLAGWFTPLQSTAASGAGTASGTITATSANGSVSTTGTLVPGTSQFNYGYAYPMLANFTITPNTGIIFTANFTGTATTTVGRVGNNTEQAVAQGYLYLNLAETSGGQQFTGYRNVNASYVTSGNSYLGQTNSFAGAVQMSYANMAGSAVSGSMYAYAYAYTQSTLPVPEPQAWALMLAGLGGMCFMARRRRQQSNA